jgi:hypothetical protein
LLIVIDDIKRQSKMDIMEKFCAFWIIFMIKSGFLSAQFSTDILYKEVNIKIKSFRFSSSSSFSLASGESS